LEELTVPKISFSLEKKMDLQYQNIQQRITSLEKKYRKIKLFFLIIIGLFLIGNIFSKEKREIKILESDIFKVVDENKTQRISLSSHLETAGIFIQDSMGGIRLSLGESVGGSGILLYDDNAMPRLFLDVGESGPKLTFFDEKGKIIYEIPPSGVE
jgi:hypothetical protein